MINDTDRADRRQSRALLVSLAVLCLLAVVASVLAWPLLAGFIDSQLEPGVGIKDAAVIAFFVAVTLLVVLAVAAGDGLLGELQYMLAALLAQFLVLWLGIAWIF